VLIRLKLAAGCTSTNVLVKRQSPLNRPQESASFHTTGGHLTLTNTYKGTLFSYWRHRRRCPFTKTSVHWTKVPSTTFETYRPPPSLADGVAAVSMVNLWRYINSSPWSFVGFSFIHITLHRLHPNSYVLIVFIIIH
jgi:hypothetical protein